MARETLDTNQKQKGNIEDGTWNFEAVSMTKKYGGANKDVPYFLLKVRYVEGDGEQILLPNMMGPLLRLLGAKEVKPNKFDFDTDDFQGFRFSATVSHEPDKKDPTKIRQHMGSFGLPMGEKKEAEIPF